MNLQTYFALANRGLDLVAECAGASVADLVAMGAAAADAAELHHLHATYFGPTPYTRKQRQARKTQHGLAELRKIESFADKARTQLDAWNLRMELCSASAADIERIARRRLRQRRKQRTYRERAQLTQHPNGLATLTVTGNSLEMTDVYGSIDQNNPAESFLECVRGGAVPTSLSTMVVMQFADYCRLLRGDGADARFQATNGAQVTGAQVVERGFLDQGLVTLIGRADGPVDLYHFTRFASDKQRAMLMAEHPQCAWPGCTVPAEQCQFHHLEAWNRGGETNVANMVPLCAYHNGVNDDEPPPRRGRMARINGRVAWIPSGGGEPVFT